MATPCHRAGQHGWNDIAPGGMHPMRGNPVRAMASTRSWHLLSSKIAKESRPRLGPVQLQMSHAQDVGEAGSLDAQFGHSALDGLMGFRERERESRYSCHDQTDNSWL